MFTRWWLRNDRNRLLLALTVILMASFVGVSLFNYLVTRDSIHSEILHSALPLTRDNIYSELSNALMRPIMVSSSMANDTFLKDWAMDGEKDPTKIHKYLEKIHEKYDFFSSFFVSNITHRYYHYKGVQKIISEKNDHDVWFYKFVQSGAEYALDVDTNEAGNNILTIFMNFRVMSPKGELLGVTGVGLKMGSVARLIKSYQQKYDRYIYLVDANGVIQVHPDVGKISSVLTRILGAKAPPLDDLLKVSAEPANFQFERDDRDILLTVRYVPELKWFIFVEQDETKSLAMARNNFLRTVLIGLIASVCILSLTLVAITRYQRKVERMAVSDELTGALNRRGLEAEFSRASYVGRRYERPFSLIIMDLDRFKQVNDELGHIAGDKVLIQVAESIRKTIRNSDILARWGGDEFVVLTENTLNKAMLLAERLRLAVLDSIPGDANSETDPRNNVSLSCGGDAMP